MVNSRGVIVLTGPPIDRRDDRRVVEYFLALPGKKVIAGGTTAKIVATYLGEPIDVDLSRPLGETPPIGHIRGIDFAAEGALTLQAALSYLRDEKVRENDTDGGFLLAGLLRDAEAIHILLGGAQKAESIAELDRASLIAKIADRLRDLGKEVEIERF